MFGKKSLLVQTVAGFMEDGEKTAPKIAGVVACIEAAIVRAEGNEERMGGGIESTTLEFEADGGGHGLAEPMLRFNGSRKAGNVPR